MDKHITNMADRVLFLHYQELILGQIRYYCFYGTDDDLEHWLQIQQWFWNW